SISDDGDTRTEEVRIVTLPGCNTTESDDVKVTRNDNGSATVTVNPLNLDGTHEKEFKIEVPENGTKEITYNTSNNSNNSNTGTEQPNLEHTEQQNFTTIDKKQEAAPTDKQPETFEQLGEKLAKQKKEEEKKSLNLNLQARLKSPTVEQSSPF
ncbi:MAG TPA: hypothetical protein VEK38_00330, partial [Candidatus Bathyarchaeia archaeon]|nr:hypothetical protein [Candidatus Bathyarchaeia archaeon]